MADQLSKEELKKKLDAKRKYLEEVKTELIAVSGQIQLLEEMLDMNKKEDAT